MKPFVTLAFVCLTVRLFGQIDTVPPVISCLNGISVNILPTGSIDVWSTDLISLLSDNQTPQNEIQTSVCVGCTSAPIWESRISLDCSDLGIKALTIWAKDLNGNTSHCSDFIEVYDDNNYCQTQDFGFLEFKNASLVYDARFCVSYDRPALWGGCNQVNPIRYPNDKLMVAVDSSRPTYIHVFSEVDFLNGVSNYDLWLLKRHLTNQARFTTPYQYLAADVDLDGYVTWSDYRSINYLIQGLTGTFPGGKSSRAIAVDSEYLQMLLSFNPSLQVDLKQFNLHEYVLAEKSKVSSFHVIKLGDISGTTSSTSRQEIEVGDLAPISISPNPVSHTATVQFYLPEAQNITWTIHDLMGKTIYGQELDLVAGDQRLQIAPELLPAPGIYALHLRLEDGLESMLKFMYQSH